MPIEEHKRRPCVYFTGRAILFVMLRVAARNCSAKRNSRLLSNSSASSKRGPLREAPFFQISKSWNRNCFSLICFCSLALRSMLYALFASLSGSLLFAPCSLLLALCALPHVPLNRLRQSGAKAGPRNKAKKVLCPTGIQAPARLAVGLARVPHDIAAKPGQLRDHFREVFDRDFFSRADVDRIGLIIFRGC